ncbi:MAG: sigma-70 family RNA polymerase sigma factor [Gemmataceae bacterium]
MIHLSSGGSRRQVRRRPAPFNLHKTADYRSGRPSLLCHGTTLDSRHFCRRENFHARQHRSRHDQLQTSLATYLRDIQPIPLLTAEEEKGLARRVYGGDAAARNHLVRANLRLVLSIARVYVGRGLPLADLFSEGNLGLLRAAEGYDPDRNTRFSTYASYWVKKSIRRALIETSRTVRVPSYASKLLSQWHRAAAELKKELYRTPSDEEVAGRLGMKRKSGCIEKASRSRNTGPQGLQEESSPSLHDLLPDNRVQAPDEVLVKAEELRHLRCLLDSFPHRAALVLRLRFGLDDEEPLTLQEIGNRLGLTRERVHQIEKALLAELAASLPSV